MSLTIVNQFGELARVASWLEQMAQHYKLAERTVFKLDLILNEAIPNIISYAYQDESSHDIMIRLENTDNHVFLEIIDDGRAFNPFSAAPLPKQFTLESSTPDGRGIHLIKLFSDNQEYQRINDTNIMRLTIRKAPESSKKSPACLA